MFVGLARLAKQIHGRCCARSIYLSRDSKTQKCSGTQEQNQPVLLFSRCGLHSRETKVTRRKAKSPPQGNRVISDYLHHFVFRLECSGLLRYGNHKDITVIRIFVTRVSPLVRHQSGAHDIRWRWSLITVKIEMSVSTDPYVDGMCQHGFQVGRKAAGKLASVILGVRSSAKRRGVMCQDHNRLATVAGLLNFTFKPLNALGVPFICERSMVT